MKIFITCGGGYIGVEVGKYFLKKGYVVYCVDNFLYNIIIL